MSAGKRLGGLRAELAQLLHLTDEISAAGVQFAGCRRKSLARAFQLGSRILQVIHETDELVVELACPIGDFDRVAVAVVEAPQAFHSLQRRQQRGRRDDRNVLLERERVQFLIAMHRFDVGGFDRHEHQHEFKRVDSRQIAVAALGKFLDMAAHRGDMRRPAARRVRRHRPPRNSARRP